MSETPQAQNKTVDTGDVVVCTGCGATTTRDDREGWRSTDADWCPKCSWLA